ncbi:MAG: hypothetical protein HQ508_05460 [Candidatus Marinimicrobia bacterium]|nr:hypothetical protein [Candidatus Neomarinimicrobiota bacterium]
MKHNIRRTLPFIILIALSVTSTSAAGIQWLPGGSIYPTSYLDPAACQQSISLLSYTVEGETEQLLYVPISLSMRQQFLRFERNPQNRWEWGTEFSIFTQFSIVDVGEA